jgi:hypothetical protein
MHPFRRKPEPESEHHRHGACIFCGDVGSFVYSWSCFLCPDHRQMLLPPTEHARRELLARYPEITDRLTWTPRNRG